MSNFNVSEAEGIFTFTWTTDKPATSQLMVILTASGVEFSPPSDNILRTSHSIEIDLQSIGQASSVTAVSVGEDLSKAMSEAFIFSP